MITVDNLNQGNLIRIAVAALQQQWDGAQWIAHKDIGQLRPFWQDWAGFLVALDDASIPPPPHDDGMLTAWDSGEWVQSPWPYDPPLPPPPPTPDLQGFIRAFSMPGENLLYGSVLQKVLSSQDGVVTDHWENFKALIRTGAMDFIGPSITYLSVLLEDHDNPLSAEDIQGWNSLVAQFHLPNCALDEVTLD